MYRREYVAGVDEVGRGPLAGAVMAAAVILNPFVAIKGLRDSKSLSAKRRDQLDIEIREKAVCFCIARAEVAEIDEINILQASMLAMQRAVAGLDVLPDFVLVDGNRIPDLPVQAEWLIKGDAKYDAIKAASIIAKVARDAEMVELDERYPEYGLAQHKGYPTAAHLEALRQYGPSPIHRMSFAPCRQSLGSRKLGSDPIAT
ncbi:MAG: ribonuclease HII [Gammaproteobacteria bacterium]|jgi:ribonuclease HII|nr:ribonuclease HII [Gammaproteobacteria bacterium]MBT7369684.1 ribonuclease HII [Gammaproteobacteria bacterium]